MDGIMGNVIMGWVRHLIGIAAGALVAKGLFDHAQAEEFSGAIATLVPLAFSAMDKMQARRATEFAARNGIVPSSQGGPQ